MSEASRRGLSPTFAGGISWSSICRLSHLACSLARRYRALGEERPNIDPLKIGVLKPMSSIRAPRSFWALGVLALVGCGSGDLADAGEMADTPEASMWEETFPTFTRHQIADFEGGGTVAFDVDGDGMQDVAALSGGSELVWFKNPTWEKFIITTGTDRYIFLAPYDVDGDGDTDLAIASEFALADSNNGGLIHWVEAPDDPTMGQEWNLHYIDAVPASHRIRWADLDGDGRKELLNLPIVGIGAIAPEYVGPSQLKAYWIPDDLTDAWETQVLDDTRLEVGHGIRVVDWDGDAAEDILTATNDGVHLFRPSLRGPPQHLAGGHDAPRPNRGSSEVSLGHLDGDRFVATIEPWHGTDAVIYTPGISEDDIWNRRVIGTEFEGGHGLAAADLNSDGYDEVIGGSRGGEGVLMIYRFLPNSDSWEKIAVDIGGITVGGLDVNDMNGDGALDIVAIGGGNVVWYENSR